MAAETMQRLRQEYKKFEQAALHLLEVNGEAILEKPQLEFVQAGLERIKNMRRSGLPGEAEYREYLGSSSEPNTVRETFIRCRGPFGAQVLAEALKDPNRAPELEPILIFRHRYIATLPDRGGAERFMENLQKRSLTVFDPNDPNDERLWQNIRRYVFESAQHKKGECTALIEQGIPKFLRDYAGEYDVMDSSYELYTLWLRAHSPEPVLAAAKAFEEAIRKLDGIQPRWPRTRHLLRDETSPEQSNVQAAVNLYEILREFLRE